MTVKGRRMWELILSPIHLVNKREMAIDKEERRHNTHFSIFLSIKP